VQTVDGRRQAYDVTLKPTDGTTALANAASSGTGTSTASGGVLKFLALAFLGGLVLNLMPCVLPILSLKILHVVHQRGAGESHAKKHSLFYLLGVVISFWVLAGLVLAGQLASWGAQFQDPRFVILMAALMTLVGLNLFGVFEIVLPGQTINKASELSTREGSTGAFFTGALSVVLGSSCAAPFLTVAIGWAFFQPPVVVLATFTAIGIGLAFPFVALSFLPVLQKFLPKPGAWMERFKQAMGFPMLATAVWLLSQTADHYGDSGPLWVGFFLLVLALAAWIFGTFIQRGGKRRARAAIVLVVIMVLGVDGTLERGLDWRHPPAVIPGNASSLPANDKSGINWQPWSHDAVARARAAGHPVLVDFTANWCPNCLANKKTSIEIDSVEEKIKTTGTVALIADYTRKNPDITAELRRFERAAVPLVLVYPKDADKPPQVLPALLTPGIVLDALNSAAQ
jgi:thiol:disulfide interchange protein DsbD